MAGWCSKLTLVMLMLASSTLWATPKDELRNKLSTLEALRAEFEQRVMRADGTSLSSMGTLALKKPSHFKMHTLDPDEQVLFTKGEDILLYDPFVNQLSIYSLKDLLDSPFMLLIYDQDSLWDRYVVESVNDGYRLKPKSGGQIDYVDLCFDGTKLSELRLMMHDGALNAYRFSKIRDEVSERDLRYEVPSDAEIDDERKSN